MAFKNIENGYIWGICMSAGDIEITKAEYNAIMQKIKTRPVAKEGFQYKLRNNDLEWELVEFKPIETETLTEDEATEIDYINALSSLGVSV